MECSIWNVVCQTAICPNILIFLLISAFKFALFGHFLDKYKGGGIYVLYILLTCNLRLLMGIQEGLCEGSKKVKKIQSLHFFLIFFGQTMPMICTEVRLPSVLLMLVHLCFMFAQTSGGNIASLCAMWGYNQW